MKKILITAIAAFVLAGCVYEFTPTIEPKDTSGLVVEGDIIIGDTSRISLSAVEALNVRKTKEKKVTGKVWIEDDSGKEYRPVAGGSSNSFEIDMTDASPDRSYRLRVSLDSPLAGKSKNYSSDWKEVLTAPSIDELTHTYDDSHVHLWLSLSSPGGSGCFRWDFEEIWEYHADSLATVYYDVEKDTVRSYEGAIPPLYWCWAYAGSTQAGIAIAKSTGGEKIVGYRFFDINRRDKRMQKLYYIKLKARGISEECYEYLHSIEVNSTSTGSLTQPDPSQIVGNIHSDDDPLEVVYGYIEVSRMASKYIYIEHLYIEDLAEPLDSQPPTGLGPMTMMEAYEYGMRPLDSPANWVSYHCVECTSEGGTKIKPDFWPTDTK